MRGRNRIGRFGFRVATPAAVRHGRAAHPHENGPTLRT